MIVLHGTWEPPESLKERGNLFIWGESSSILPVKHRGRPQKTGTERAHPFQTSKKDLESVIESLNPADAGSISKKAHPDTVFLFLPSYPRSPQASPDLLRDNGSESVDDTVSLSQWKVSGLSIQPEEAVLLLGSLSGVWAGNGSAVIGTDLRFWSKVSKFAMELLSKQHFVPGIVLSEDGTAFARWQYVLNDEDDRIRMSMLARSMPPVCRALYQKIPNTQDVFLSGFLNSAIDSCIRCWIPISKIRSKKPGLSEAWLQSLATGEPIKASVSNLKNLHNGILSWEAPIRDIEKSEFRTCFRLEPPESIKPGTWNLRYFLQASDDPSLLVPAGKVWKESMDTLQFLNRKFDHPQEKLLADLGKASRLYPPIEDSLHSARPGEAQLTTQQAYTFLKEAVPLC